MEFYGDGMSIFGDNCRIENNYLKKCGIHVYGDKNVIKNNKGTYTNKFCGLRIDGEDNQVISNDFPSNCK